MMLALTDRLSFVSQRAVVVQPAPIAVNRDRCPVFQPGERDRDPVDHGDPADDGAGSDDRFRLRVDNGGRGMPVPLRA